MACSTFSSLLHCSDLGLTAVADGRRRLDPPDQGLALDTERVPRRPRPAGSCKLLRRSGSIYW